MFEESPKDFAARHRWAVGLFSTVATVVLLVVVYRVTAPKTSQTGFAPGQRSPDGDVLKVGALPVT
jgi:hypothetical protein